MVREVGDIVLWEQIMPYAVAFGLAKKVIKALKAEFSVAETDPSDHSTKDDPCQQ